MDEQNNLYIEQAILGALLRDGNCWDVIADKLTASHFTIDAHRRVFNAMVALSVNRSPIDVITVADELEGNWHGEEKPLFYCGTLAQNSSSSANIGHYTDLLVRDTTKRRLHDVGLKITELAESGEEPAKMIAQAENMLVKIHHKSERLQVHSINDMMAELLNRLDGDKPKALPTGFKDLDSILDGGLRPGELIVLAGRPGSGKTTLGMCIAQNVVLQSSKPVFVFSMEMTREALAERVVASVAEIEAYKLRRENAFNEYDYTKLTSAIGLLSKGYIRVCEAGGLKPSEIRSVARRAKRENPDLALILVDYLQLMRSDTKYENRVNEIGECSGALKALAKEMNIPIIALAQLNRNSVKSGEVKRPSMSDLRDSGSIEQDSDVVALIYREYLHDNTKPADFAELIIDKQRSGETGTINLTFNGKFNKFKNWTPSETTVIPISNYAKPGRY